MVSKLLIFAFTVLLISNSALANPIGGEVTAGEATIVESGNLIQINQTSQKAIVNWQSFNIQAGEHTHFQQAAGGIALNRISPTQGPSQIFGQLSSTGKIILVNQAGVFFGSGAQVNVGGIIASTSNISDQNFLAGKLTFDQPSSYNGSIINQGTINTADYGLVALIGTGVVNNGMISARLGNVVLASGNKFTVDLNGDQLINFSIDEAATRAGVDQNGNSLKNGVHNDGSLIADGGTILVTGKVASGVVDQVVNMEGVATANSVYKRKGTIILSAHDGNVRVKGKLIATGKRGGKIKVLGKRIAIKSTATLDASGKYGGGEILVGGNYQGKGPEYNALTTSVDQGATLKADALTSGNGGRIIVWSDSETYFNGTISARGGEFGGNGGFAETSGHYLDVNGSYVDLRAPLGNTGLWLLDPTDVFISNGADTNLTIGGTTYQPTDGTQGTTVINASSLATALNSSNIMVTTTPSSGSGGGGSGDITVVDPVTWTGATTLTLNALNNININADISAVNGGLTLISGVGITIPANITIGLSFSMTANGLVNDVTGNIAGLGSVAIASDTYQFTGNNTYSGGTFLNGAILRFNDDTNLGTASGSVTFDNSSSLIATGTTTLNANRELILSSGTNSIRAPSGTLTINGLISGAGNAVMSNLNLAHANTYTGQTTTSGTINYSIANAISPVSSVFNGGTINLNDFSSTIHALSSSTSGILNLGSNANTNLTINGDGSIYQGAINGSGNIIKVMTGSQTFTGGTASTYTGTTTISGGTLNIGTDLALGAAPGSPTQNKIILDGGTLNLSSAFTLNANRGITLTSNGGTLATTGVTAGVYNGIIQGTGNILLISMNLGGTNTYTGNTSLAGTNIINSDAALGQSGSGQTLTFNTGSTLRTTQTFSLNANRSLRLNATGNITADTGTTLTILGTINGNNANTNLNLQGLGSIALQGVIGGTTALLTLTTQSTLANVTLGNDIKTSGIQTYNGPISLAVGTTPILSTTNSTVTFANTVNGPGGLDISTGTGAINFNSSVGTTTALTSLSDSIVGAASRTVTFSSTVGNSSQPLGSLVIYGNATINGGSVYTSGAQNYLRAVTLGADTTLTTGNFISFSVDGITGTGRNLTLQGTGSSGTSFFINNNTNVNNLTVTGSSGSTILSVDSGAVTQTWTTTGSNTGNVSGISSITGTFGFSNIASLVGGTNTDLFLLTGGALSGTVDGGAGTNTLTAGNVSNTWAITGVNAGIVTGTGGFSHIQNLIGGTNDDSFSLNGGTVSGTISGGTGTNTLTADNVSNSWNISALNTGTLTGTGGFNSIQNLVGGSNNDAFIFSDGISIGGNINGSGGTNTLNLSAYTTAVNVNLATTSATAIGGTFSNLNSFIGGSGNNALTGDNTTNTWNITANNSGITNSTTSFSAFANLTGGSNNDNFVFSDGVQLTGNLSDNGGTTNALNLSAYTTNVNVNSLTGTATGIGGTFNGINSFTGGSGNNSFTGPNTANVWLINAANSGSIGSHTFNAFGNLVGGSDNDDFVFISSSASVSGNLVGNAGINSLDYSSYASPVTVNLQTNTGTGIGGTFSNMSDFVGYGPNSTLVGANTVNTWNITGINSGNFNSTVTFSSFRNLTGGSANDNFVFDNAALVNGNIVGNSGVNTINLSAYLSSATINLETNTSTGISGGTFSNITNFIGTNNILSTIIGPTTANNNWAVTSLNSGNINSSTFTFSGFGNLEGSVISDTNDFIFTGTGAVSGNVTGGSIQDTLDFTGLSGSPQIDVTLTGIGTYHGYAGTSSTVIGGSFDNIDIINNTASVLNTLTGPNVQTRWQVGNTANSGTVVDVSAQTLTYSNFINLIGQGADNILEDTIGGRNWSITGSNEGAISGVVQSFAGMQTLLNTGIVSDFIFSDGQNFSGTINGSGNDVLDYSAHSALNPIEAFLSSSNGGSVDSNSVTASFTGIATMIGTAGDDTFNITDNAAALSGDIIGNGGLDTISGFSLDSAFVIDLTNNTSNKLGGNFNGIENFIGTANSALDSRLIGPSNHNIWTINVSNAGDINGIYTFERFGNLTGGSTSLSNIFNFINAGEISGSLIGGNNSDTLDFTGLSGSPTINTTLNNIGTTHGYAGTAQPVIGLSFDNIDFIFNTSSGNNTLTGANRNTNWTFIATDSGSLSDNTFGHSLDFTGFNHIIGGTSDDTFNFVNNSTLTGTLDGGDTTSLNQLNFSNYPEMETVELSDPIADVIDAGTVNDALGGLVVNFSRIQSFEGDGLSLIFPPSASFVQFTNPSQLDGIIYMVPSLPFTFINARVFVPNNGGGNASNPSTSTTNGLDQIIYEMINPLAMDYPANDDLDITQDNHFERTVLKCIELDRKNIHLCNKINVFLISQHPSNF